MIVASWRRRLQTANLLPDGSYVLGGGATAAADDLCPGVDARGHALRKLRRFHIKDRLVVRQARFSRIRMHRDGLVGGRPQEGDDSGHLHRVQVTAVGSYDIRPGIGELPGTLFGSITHHRPAAVLVCLERDGYNNRKAPMLFAGPQRTQCLAQIEHGLNNEPIHAGLCQGLGLLPEGVVELGFSNEF